jgi:Dienelactone hydrolase family
MRGPPPTVIKLRQFLTYCSSWWDSTTTYLFTSILLVLLLAESTTQSHYCGGSGCTPSAVAATPSGSSVSLFVCQPNAVAAGRCRLSPPPPRTIPMTEKSTTSSASAASDGTVLISDWTPLNPESLVSAPCLIEQTLCQSTGTSGGTTQQQPRLAGSVQSATAILEAWRREEAESDCSDWDAEWASVRYWEDENHATHLHGHWVRKPPAVGSSNTKAPKSVKRIVLFHTGAGPHDLFLLWKAVALVNDPVLNSGEDGTDLMVMIADVLSDELGWAWDSTDDRSKFRTVTSELLRHCDTSCGRPVLQDRIRAAINCCCSSNSRIDGGGTDNDNDPDHHPVVAVDQIAALGWCLGGHCISELARMQEFHPQLSAMATFHGVFTGAGLVAHPDNKKNDVVPLPSTGRKHCEVLICHGCQDPFVPDEDLENALYVVVSFDNCVNCKFVRQTWGCQPSSTSRSRCELFFLFFFPFLCGIALVELSFSTTNIPLLYCSSKMPNMDSLIQHKSLTTIRRLHSIKSRRTRLGGKQLRSFAGNLGNREWRPAARQTLALEFARSKKTTQILYMLVNVAFTPTCREIEQKM